MDDTQASIKTAEAAAATRKRRSSILKSQRPPRTPFTELEFNVATPTNSPAKSRRVSFSRKTGVAEFVTNEATTTWKNFYEEHNKSLESSANESAANAPCPVIGHIGKRIFDQQFEEVEVVDIGGTLQTNTAIHEFQSSFNNVNLTQQLMAFELDCVGDDKKLAAPVQHFELSNLTDHHSKVFGDDLSMPVMNDMSNPISMNFSNIQPLGKCDDLEEIARDLERPHPHVMCRPFSSKDVSEYIEVDLNMTNVLMRNDDFDMSITDTIQSPKVQAVKQTPHHDTISNETLVDKENIVMNPYVTPKESANFAINEQFDKVLVFDGKKLSVQSERQPIPVVNNEETVQPKVAMNTDAVPKRKTIVLNVNDDLPNFISDNSSLIVNHITNKGEDFKKSVLYNDCDLSITQAVGSKVEKPKRKTIVFEDDMGNISITQAIPAKVIINEEEKRKTVIYENNTAEISITQAVSTNIIKQGIEKTVVYEDDLSFTQVLPGNLVLNKTSQDKTIYYQDAFDISVTKAIPDIIIKSKREPQREENDISNISMTRAISSNIIIDRSKHDSDNNHYDDFKDEDRKQEKTENSNNKNEKRKTIVYDNEAGNISLTQAIPTNILLENKMNIDKIDTNTANESLNITNFEKPSNKRKTIIYDNDQGEISMTQAIPSNIIHVEAKTNNTQLNDYKNSNPENKDNRRNTILYDNEEGNISMTQVIPANIIQALYLKNKVVTAGNADLVNVLKNTTRRKTIIYDNEDGDVSMTQAIPSNIMNQPKSEINEIEDVKNNRRKTIIYVDQDADVSMTQVMPSNIILTQPVKEHLETNDDIENDPNIASGQRKSVIYDNDEGDVSITQSMPSNLILTNAEITKTEMSTNDIDMDISITRPLPTNIFTNEKNDNDMNLTNVNQNNSLRNNLINNSKVFEQSNCGISNISLTKPIPSEIMDIQKEISEKGVVDPRKSLFDAELKEVSVQQDILVYQSIEHNMSRPIIKTDVSFKIEDNQICLNTSKINNTSVKCLNKSNISSVKENYMEEKYDIENKTLTEQKSFSKNNSLVFPKQNKKSILNELLDMSNASLIVDPLDKQLIENPVKMTIEDVKPNENESSNSLFFITRDSENDMKKEDIENEEKIPNNTEIIEVTQKYTHYSDEDEKHELQNELDEPVIVNEEFPKSNRHYEKMLSSDIKKGKILDKSDLKMNRSVLRDIKFIRDADDTKDLLEMLSDFTDGATEERGEKSVAANVRSQVSSPEPRRLSFLPKRQSIALCREELFNNISMAQAALQMSRSYNDSDNIEDTHESPEEIEKYPNKTVRMSTEVVKTLNFEDDESISEASMGTDMKTTPLKKTTVGEITYMKDDKAKVIPTYLKDVSDGIKALMNDLVKPTADIPFEGESLIKKPPSTCSTQIQANIVTSSQIDIGAELHSNPESIENSTPKKSIEAEVADLAKGAITQALRQSIKPMDISMEVEQKPVSEINKSPVSILLQSPTARPSPVIVFDHLNPLNNILITQTDCSKVHGYNPIKMDDSKEDDKVQNDKKKENQNEIERVSTHHQTEKRMSQQKPEVHVGDGVEKINESNSKESNISKPLSIDRSTEGMATEHKDTEINTLIAMKDNKEILETNSSLTLVDDALGQPLDIDMQDFEDCAGQKSSVKIIYKVEEDVQKDFDVTSNDESEMNSNSRKRSYSPTKQDKKMVQPVDVTPKPVSKMQKVSLSPKVPESKTKSPDIKDNKMESPDKNNSSPDKKKSPKKRNSMKQDLTVQQVIVDCYKDASADRNIDRKYLESYKNSTHESLAVETVSNTFESMKSETTFTSSKKAVCKVLSENSDFDQKSDEESSKTLTDFSSAVNVVTMIEMLPFMGGRNCEWETRDDDVWTFLLLRSRLRLTVRLSRPPRRVRPDTPLVALDVTAVHDKEKEPSSSLCVRLAAEAMRYECAQCGCVGAGAGAVPALLRRCAETARLALLWARVMRDARLRLAYHLTGDGDLTFKVANTRLRAVWEVRLRVELVVGDAAQSAWPRAARVRVLPALPAPAPAPRDLQRLLDGVRHDWGHAPTTICTVFIENTEKFVKSLESEVGKQKTDIYPFIANMTLSSICETAMGTQLDEETSGKFRDCVIKQRRDDGNYKNLYVEVMNDSEENFYSIKKKRLAMLDLLLDIEEQGKIDTAGINEEVDTFMFEGNDTTSAALLFTFMLLANHPEVQDKAFEECLNIFGTSKRTATMSDLAEMKYLECCIKESLRLYPPVYFISRTCDDPLNLKNYKCPPGIDCVILIIDLHRRSDQFVEPMRFKPERFMEEPTWHPFAYIPFSAGPRNCIGQRFAMMEMKLVLSAALRKYRLLPVTRPLDINFIADIILRPKDPIYVKFEER
ncbi:unnamed protein product, partial [Brenthis ino]